MMEPRTLRDLARAWNNWGSTVDLNEIENIAQQFGLLDAFMFGLWVARDLGMLRRDPPPWRAPRAARLRRVLSTRRLLRPSQQADRLPYLRMAAMGALLPPKQRWHLLQTYLFPPAEKVGFTSKSIRLWGRYAARLVHPLWRKNESR
jgi:hypothetical protein